MQHVSGYWYRFVNYIAVGLNALYLVVFSYFSWQQQDLVLQKFGLYAVPAGIALIQIVYGLIGFNLLVRKKDPVLLSLLSLGMFITNLLVVLSASGDFESPYVILIMLVGLVAGAYGIYFVLTTGLIFTTYFVLIFPGLLKSIESISTRNYLILLASYLCLVIGYAWWRRSYANGGSVKSPILDLSQELKQKQNQSQILINSIGDGVVVVNQKGMIELFNPAACKLSGWEATDAIGLDYNLVLKFVDSKGDLIPETDNILRLVTSKPEAKLSDDLILQAKNGDITELSVSASPVKDSDGSLTAIIAVMRDVSEQRRQERQRADFISTASHEMRTPVAAIEGYIALALNPKVSTIDEKAHGFLLKAHESTQHLGDLFRDLLTASKSEDGRLENHPEPIEVGTFLKSIAEDVKFITEKKGLTVTVTHGGQEKANMSPIYYIYADPERIREVIVNLVDNAIKFTSKGGITIDLHGDLESVIVSVTDTGYGIETEDIEHLFQKFYRIDNSATRTVSGTGLGLFICKQIIEMYKGRIWAESQIGNGTTFYISLPRLDQDRAERLIAQRKGDSPAIAPSLSPGSIIGQPEVDLLKSNTVASPVPVPSTTSDVIEQTVVTETPVEVAAVPAESPNQATPSNQVNQQAPQAQVTNTVTAQTPATPISQTPSENSASAVVATPLSASSAEQSAIPQTPAEQLSVNQENQVINTEKVN